MHAPCPSSLVSFVFFFLCWQLSLTPACSSSLFSAAHVFHHHPRRIAAPPPFSTAQTEQRVRALKKKKKKKNDKTRKFEIKIGGEKIFEDFYRVQMAESRAKI